MELIRQFKGLNKGDAEIAGGKGASLGEMTQAGISVPDGFVVLSEAFERFLEETDLSVEIDAILQSVNKDEMRSVEHASEKIQSLILRAKMPEDIESIIQDYFKKLDTKYVAVRSSATAEDSSSAAWAGQLESYLNTTEGNLLEKVQECWASLFTARAIFYRFEKELHATKISVAVVVQEMINSEISGIAFSVHPVTEDRNQLIIEAGLGLGEAIVSGSVTPDSYVVKKDSREIIDVNISTQTKAMYRIEGGGNEWKDLSEPQASSQVLTERQTLELSELIVKIENHYGFPCDIEWAWENKKFYIVQSRPITTLSDMSALLSQRVTLSKYMSREHTLFYAHVWNESNRDCFDQYVSLTDIKSMLFVLSPQGVLEVYYDLKELDESFYKIEESIKKQPEILDKVISDFYDYWGELTPYVIEGRKIETSEELKKYYKNWVNWWAAMAYIFILPDMEKVPESLREKALKVREETQEYSNAIDKVYVEFIREKYPQHLKIAHLFLPEEVWRIESLTKQEIENINSRENNFALATIEGISTSGSFEEISQKLNNSDISLEEVEVSDTNRITGVAVSSGKVKAKAKLVFRKSDMSKVEKGDIIVSPMTTPDFLPAMQRAAAIITDEGGITCHAAIVARELKKPCIIGTKIATQVLKDGDLVEVDADSGVVRVIESSDKDFTKDVFEKVYTRENCLISFQVWEEHQTRRLLNVLDWVAEPAIFDVTEGVAGIYYRNGTFDQFDRQIEAKLAKDDQFIRKTMDWYAGLLDYLDVHWHSKKPLESTSQLMEFFDKAVDAWCALDVSYEAPSMSTVSESDKKLAMSFREKAADFLEEVDHVFQRTLRKMYPDLGELIKYIQIEEVKTNTIPSLDVLEQRAKHFIYYRYEVLTGITFDKFLEQNKFEIIPVKIPLKSSELLGQVAMGGKVIGKVRVLNKKAEIPFIKEGEILVTAMTTPDYLPAMLKAAAFVTDEGGITCHAAIVARELKKPCVIGTKIATQVLKDGDLVEVDADSGVVRMLESSDKDFVKDEWMIMKTGLSPLILGYNIDSWMKVSVDRYGDYAPLKKFLLQIKDSGNIGTIAVSKNDYISSAKYLLENQKQLDAIFSDFDKDEKAFVDFIDKLERGQVEIGSSFQEFMDKYNTMYSSGITFDGFLVYGDEVVNEIKNKYSQSIEKEVDVLTGSPELTFSQREEMDLLYIVLNDENDKQKRLKEHTDSFHWVLNNYKNVSRLSQEYFEERANGLSGQDKDQVKEKFTELSEYKIIHSGSVKDIQKESALRDEDLDVLLLLGKIGWYVDRRKALNLIGNYWIGEYIRVECEKHDVKLSDALLLMPEEFDAVLKKNRDINSFNLVKRKAEFGISYLDQTLEVVFDESLEKIKVILEPEIEESTSVSEIKGNTAYKGKVQGYVKVMNFVDEKVFNENEILVTSMTRPDFVPLMRKAGAIVTNEGGVTSHAAIISREMKKPCIIGTKIATQVLKDGDLVEVDADSGVVRVIEKTSQNIEKKTQINFEKVYTRDTTMIIQQAWNDCVIRPYFSTETNPFTPSAIHYMNEGAIEIWENKDASQWILDSMQEFIKKDELKLISLVEQYESDLLEVEELRKKGPLTDINKLEEYINRVFAMMKGFDCMYIPSIDERTPDHVRERLLKLRDNDAFFDSSDSLIRSSLIAIYPDLKGYESAILKNEIKNPPTLEVLKARKISFVVIGEEVAEQIILQEYLAKHPELYFHIETAPVDKSVLVGQVGNKGYAKGVVHILKRKEQIDSVLEGDIIVSPMTTPDFLPAMKKATAIVTDEGGVTCHAAIVARELKKPCVIGTKFATQILKDGDLVEVDADNGVVRILESEDDGGGEKLDFSPESIEWHKLMERKNLFFVGLVFADIESVEFEKIMDFELKYFLFKFEKGNWSTYKSNIEFENLYRHISDLIKSDDERFFNLAKKGIVYNSEGSDYVQKHASKPTEPTIDNFNYEYKLFCNLLLYGVTIPWDVIGAIETLSKTEQKKYKSILDVFEPLRAVSLYPDYEKEVFQKYRVFLSEKYNIDVSLLNLLTPHELEQALADKFVPSKDLLQKRYDYCVFWFNPESKKTEFTYDPSIESKIPVLQNVKVEKMNIVKGVNAYKGLVKGRVRVIYEQEDCESFQEGEILVTPSTNPSLMAAIMKCAGIVTDEGGMTSHAAIIARELKKPAVIGTKIATHILSDGDLVEVDADSGVVRVLNDAKPDLDDYVRLFAFDGAVPFLFSYQFVEVADWLNYLAFGDDHSWISYMDKRSINRANQEGLELYRDIESYKKYSNGFYETNESIRKLTVEIVQEQKISKAQLDEFFKLLATYRWHYTRTEFFFTDLAFEKKDEFPNIAKNFETFEKLKIDGRQYLNEIFLMPDSCLVQVFDVLGKQFDLTIDYLNRYSSIEIRELFEGKKISERLVEERVNHVHYMKEGKLISISGSNAVTLIDHLKQSGDAKEIHGKTAYGGRVTAKARVITIDVKDYDKAYELVEAMQDGEVLVAETTEPSIILACKKASAIVTNQGGMMSHAAITAREMEIPCVVGTSVATDKIKTGDMVEVDADSGVVRVIKKENACLLKDNALSTDDFDVSKYCRLFRLQGIRFFINDMYSRAYPDYGFIILIKDGDYVSYMQSSGIEKAHKEGLDLLSDNKGEFQEYQQNIISHWNQVSEFHQTIQQLESVTHEQINTYLELCRKSFEFYKYTEFIFTEHAFEVAESKNNQLLKENVIKMGDIKNESRTYMNLLFLGGECTTHRMLSMISKQFDIPISNLLEYGELELKEVFNGYTVPQNIVSQRQQGSIIENKNDELGYLWGLPAVEIFDQFVSSNEEKIDSIKGVTANSGKVKGRVYILSSGYDNFTTLSQYIDEMEVGDVLVSETTSPDLMSACKKASAIVTNQGGMMSHAAIVSRELNIPCIVGTHTATQDLNNGDLVEVDADNGVITIVEKSS